MSLSTVAKYLSSLIQKMSLAPALLYLQPGENTNLPISQNPPRGALAGSAPAPHFPFVLRVSPRLENPILPNAMAEELPSHPIRCWLPGMFWRPEWLWDREHLSLSKTLAGGRGREKPGNAAGAGNAAHGAPPESAAPMPVCKCNQP